MSEDPIGESGGVNVYEYAKNNSISLSDYSGNFAFNQSQAFGGAVGLTLGYIGIAGALVIGAPFEITAVGVGLAVWTLADGIGALIESFKPNGNPNAEPYLGSPVDAIGPLNSQWIKYAPFDDLFGKIIGPCLSG